VSVSRSTLSILNSTEATPISSEAVAAMVIVSDTVTPSLGVVIETIGGVVSGGGEAPSEYSI